jgi:hypothetical protein
MLYGNSECKSTTYSALGHVLTKSGASSSLVPWSLVRSLAAIVEAAGAMSNAVGIR